MLRDAELAARDYTTLACAGLPTETDINLVTATLRQVASAVSLYADPSWAPTGWQLLADTARTCLAATEPGSGFQLAWARAFVSAARTDADLAILRGWLAGAGRPGRPGDRHRPAVERCSRRWSPTAHAEPAEIEAELDRDRTASGERAAALAHALVPTAASKAETWRRLTGEESLPNSLQRSLLMGFYHPTQLALTAPYVSRFFDVVDEIWATRDSEPAQEFAGVRVPDVLRGR